MNNCTLCDHPLIDHGYDPESTCDCCTGRSWVKSNSGKDLEPKKNGRSDGRIPRGYIVCEDFPDYMVDKRGTVKHIATGKFCFLLRLSKEGYALISLRKDNKNYIESAQSLRDKAFGQPHSTKQENN